MKSDLMNLETKDGVIIYYYRWLPEEESQIKGIVQIAHGMAEHALRYERFAQFLTQHGFVVFASDHRGHGKTAGPFENSGFFAQENGWNLVVNDIHNLTNIIKDTYKGKPIFLFGHSMGSFLSRSFLFDFGNEIKGVILSGTGGDPGIMGKIGRLIAKYESNKKGKRHRSILLNKLSFGSFNNAFKPNRTDFDWLSRDNAEVDKYIKDEYCGFVCTSGLFVDLLTGIIEIHKKENLIKMPKNLPVYFMSGEKDPVGNNAKGVNQVAMMFQKAGLNDVNVKIYTEGRHEMLNEINRTDVFEDILFWLESKL